MLPVSIVLTFSNLCKQNVPFDDSDKQKRVAHYYMAYNFCVV